jgi:hypothetical protein
VSAAYSANDPSVSASRGLTLPPEAPADRGRRLSRSHAAAAILNAAAAVFGVVYSMPVLAGGQADSDQVPWPIVVISFVGCVLCLVSSYGVWRGQRWGVVLTIVLNAIAFITGAPGIVFGPSAFLVVGSIVGCALNIVVVYLLLRRGPARRARGERV